MCVHYLANIGAELDGFISIERKLLKAILRISNGVVPVITHAIAQWEEKVLLHERADLIVIRIIRNSIPINNWTGRKSDLGMKISRLGTETRKFRTREYIGYRQRVGTRRKVRALNL